MKAPKNVFSTRPHFQGLDTGKVVHLDITVPSDLVDWMRSTVVNRSAFISWLIREFKAENPDGPAPEE